VEKPESRISLPCADVLQSGKTLTGALFGGLKAKSDIPILLKRYMDKVNFSFLAYHGLSKTVVIQQYNWLDNVTSFFVFAIRGTILCVHVTVSRIFLVPSGHIKHLSSYFPLGDLCFGMLILSGFADACLLTKCFFSFRNWSWISLWPMRSILKTLTKPSIYYLKERVSDV